MTRPETVEALADWLATERDKFPRRPDDIDSLRLAAALLDAIGAGQVPGLVLDRHEGGGCDE